MSHLRVRRGGIEFPVAGPEALLRLARDGALGPDDRVLDPALGTWKPAAELPALAEAFETRRRAAQARALQGAGPRVQAAGSPPPANTLDPVPGPPPGPEPAAIAGAPVDGGAAPKVPPAPGPTFEVPPDLEGPSEPILGEAQPARRRAVLAGGNLRAQGQPPLPSPSAPAPRPAPAAPPPSVGVDARRALDDPAFYLRQAAPTPPRSALGHAVRPSLLLMTVIVGLIGAFLLVSYVQHDANVQYARLASVTAELDGPTAAPLEDHAGAAQAPPAPRDAETLYERMELELRNRMVPGCSSIGREDELDTALRVELSRLGVQAQSIHAPILTWGGRKGDIPLAVEIKIWYEGRAGELDRELAAIGLVVGKYAQNYGLDVRAFEVFLRGEGGETRKRTLSADAARQLYMRRASIVEFLTAETP